jgi:hypothetical protein
VARRHVEAVEQMMLAREVPTAVSGKVLDATALDRYAS